MTTKQEVRMHTGILWFDNDPKTTLSVKIQKAIEYYTKKFGKVPNICLVHPSMLNVGQKNIQLGDITVREYRSMVFGHIWIGIEEVGAPVAKFQAALKSI